MKIKYVGPKKDDVSGYGYNFPEDTFIEIGDERVIGKCQANPDFECDKYAEAEDAVFEEVIPVTEKVEDDGDSTGSEKRSTKKPRRNKIRGVSGT